MRNQYERQITIDHWVMQVRDIEKIYNFIRSRIERSGIFDPAEIPPTSLGVKLRSGDSINYENFKEFETDLDRLRGLMQQSESISEFHMGSSFVITAVVLSQLLIYSTNRRPLHAYIQNMVGAHKKIEIQKESNNKIGQLLNFGYFRNAQLSVKYLLSQKNIGKTQVPRDIKKIPDYNAPFTIENGATLLAARYNFKHALELSMKSLFSIGEKAIPKGHDLKILLNKMKKELLNHSILTKSFEAWEWLITEYSSKDRFTPNDEKNELDRYIFNQTGATFPYQEIYRVTRRDLQLFLKDIETAKQLFHKMEAEYQFIKYCKKFSLDPELNNSSKTSISKLSNGRYITKMKSNATNK